MWGCGERGGEGATIVPARAEIGGGEGGLGSDGWWGKVGLVVLGRSARVVGGRALMGFVGTTPVEAWFDEWVDEQVTGCGGGVQ